MNYLFYVVRGFEIHQQGISNMNIIRSQSESERSFKESVLILVNYSYFTRILLVFYSYVLVFYSYVLVCCSYVTRMYSYMYVTRMLLVCTRVLLVCTRVLLVCIRMLLVCYSYVLVWCFSHDRLRTGSQAELRACIDD
jgi:hypothetical protein